MYGIAIRYVQHCQTMLARGVIWLLTNCFISHAFYYRIKSIFVSDNLKIGNNYLKAIHISNHLF